MCIAIGQLCDVGPGGVVPTADSCYAGHLAAAVRRGGVWRLRETYSNRVHCKQTVLSHGNGKKENVPGTFLFPLQDVDAQRGQGLKDMMLLSDW